MAGERITLGLGGMLLLVLLALLPLAEANTKDICARDPPNTDASKTPGDNGFRIKIAGNPPPEKYTPGQVYTISINGTYHNQKLLGFMLVSVPLNAQDETNMIGTFQHLNSGLTKSADACYWVVHHTYDHPKAGVELLWVAPDAGTGCVEFRATVVEYSDIWYKDDGALTRVFCEDTGTTENDQPAGMMPECCACGAAKYEVVFEGLWSRQSHPTDYPTHQALLHWSNIVGASHNKHYLPWQYGAFASSGVQQVCEFGYPSKLEEEMRQHSQDVRTVIKTPGIWHKEGKGLLQTRWARFSVNRKHHLLSLLSMIGPSPDWCVGVSALNLCLSNCTWAGDSYIDLYPWDAGTDDGVSYMSANQRSDPPQKIHRITNTFPHTDASPFFGEEPIRPLARLKIKRLHPKPGSTVVCSPEDEEDEEDEHTVERSEDVLFTDMEKEKRMRMLSGKCGMSEWMAWTECSVTCGVGMKVRKRLYLNPMVDEDMCGLPTMEKENCIGVENECGEVLPGCEATQWSEWSPCSVTCGRGDQQRRRYYLSKDALERGCGRSMDETQACVADLPDCAKAAMMMNFTVICNMPRKEGSCRGSFERWYYDKDMRKCLRFNYSGCRGNQNQFRSQEECAEVCAVHAQEGPSEEEFKKQMMLKQQMMEQEQMRIKQEMMEKEQMRIKQEMMESEQMRIKQEMMEREQMRIKQEMMEKQRLMEQGQTEGRGQDVDCVMSPWSAWSACSATCGKAFKYKRRLVRQAAQGQGRKCPKRLERKKRCDLPKCARDCELGEWGEWTPCLHSCVQERTRAVLHRPKRGGGECGPRLSRRNCNEYPCLASDTDKVAEIKKKRERRRRRRRH